MIFTWISRDFHVNKFTWNSRESFFDIFFQVKITWIYYVNLMWKYFYMSKITCGTFACVNYNYDTPDPFKHILFVLILCWCPDMTGLRLHGTKVRSTNRWILLYPFTNSLVLSCIYHALDILYDTFIPGFVR